MIEAFLQVEPQRYLPPQDAESILLDHFVLPVQSGLPPGALPISLIAVGLEALEPSQGDRVADLGAVSGYVSSLLSYLAADGAPFPL